MRDRGHPHLDQVNYEEKHARQIRLFGPWYRSRSMRTEAFCDAPRHLQGQNRGPVWVVCQSRATSWVEGSDKLPQPREWETLRVAVAAFRERGERLSTFSLIHEIKANRGCRDRFLYIVILRLLMQCTRTAPSVHEY
jgi:hypothetical protein